MRIQMSSCQNPLHVSSCYCCGYHFGGGPIAFQSFLKINIRDPTWSQNPFLNWPGNALRSCFVLCALATLHVPFVLHLIYLHAFSFVFPSFACSFHWYSFSFMFLSQSFYFHSNVHSCPLICLSSAPMFFSCCIHVFSFPFKIKLWKWHEMALWLGQGTECNNYSGCR